MKRSSSLTKSKSSKKPASKLNLKLSTPQTDRKSRSGSTSLQYSVSYNHLTEKYRKSNSHASEESSFPRMLMNHNDWKLELGYSNNIQSIRRNEPEYDASDYYFKFFEQERHQNFLAEDSEGKPVSISIVKLDNEYKILYRYINGNQIVSLNVDKAKSNNPKKLVKLYAEKTLSSVREVKDIKHFEELKLFHSNETFTKFKFGILYCEKGQTQENEMFSNQNASPEFEEFLTLLGEKVTLKDFGGYSGGLDTSRDSTGTHSIYTKFNGYEIMFHVSTLLPYNEGCEQQLERKRHIGNDVVLIVFQNGSDEPYSPDTVTTHFHHIIAVVQRCDENGTKKYKVQLARKREVPEFEPELPNPPIFESEEEFKNFLLTKLINGEKASMKSSTFKEKISRTRAGLLSYYNTAYPKK